MAAALASVAAPPAAPPGAQFAFFPAKETAVFQGEGGTPSVVDGVEIWRLGRPARRNRVLGTLIAYANAPEAPRDPTRTDEGMQDALTDVQLAAAARSLHADAVIPVLWQLEGGRVVGTFRIAKFLDDAELADLPTRFDAALHDTDGQVVPNDSEIPVEFAVLPDVGRYLNASRSGPGYVIVHFCVGADGLLTGAPSIVNSTNPKLNEGSIRLVTEAKFKPATLLGRPVQRCKVIKVSASMPVSGDRPDSSRLGTIFQTAAPGTLFRGEGGTPAVVEDVEIWHSGRPSRRNRLLGTVVISTPWPGIEYAPAEEPEWLKAPVESKAVAAARRVNAGALIPFGLRAGVDTLTWHYRAVQYVPDGEEPDAPVTVDATPRDAAGNIVPNGSERPIQFHSRPDVARLARSRGAGSVVLRICADKRGRLSQEPVVVSSTNVNLNAATIRMMKNAWLVPATLNGQAIPHCQGIPIDVSSR